MHILLSSSIADILTYLTISIIIVALIIMVGMGGENVLKKISALKARQNLGQVMNEVALRGDDYIIERAGRPLVAIIDLEKYDQLQRNYDELLEEVKEIRFKAKDAKSENIDQAIAEAVLAAKKAEFKVR